MKSQWHVFNLKANSVSLSFATKGKLGDAEFSYDGKYVAILGAQDQHDPATGRLYLANAKTGQISDWLPGFKGHIADFEWANKSNHLYFSANVGTESFVAKIKPGSAKYKTQLKPGKLITGKLSVSDSDKTIALAAHSRNHPNEVFMLRSKKRHV